MEYPGFIGGSYQSESPLADCERTVNWYVENLESPGATKKAALYPVPGATQIPSVILNPSADATVAASQQEALQNGPGRAHFFENDMEYAILANWLFSFNAAGDATALGTVGNDGLPATISSNGDGGGQLFITSNRNGFVFDVATQALSAVTALLGKADLGAYLDGRFLAIDSNTSTLYLSDLLDGTTWQTGTLFAQRVTASDPWLAAYVVGKYIWLLGEKTGEAWYNAGTSPFPLATVPNGLIQTGILARFSARVIGQDLYWLGINTGGSPAVMKLSGSSPEVISTHPMDRFLQGYSSYETVTADVQSDRGHTFYILHFPGAISWAFDTETGIWCERGSWNNGGWDATRGVFTRNAFGKARALDRSGGYLYIVDETSTTEIGGLAIRRLRRAPAIESENKRIYYPEFELAIEPGLGNIVDPGSDPQVMLRLSNDAGKTWSPEYWRTAGKTGKYLTRIHWHRLGSARRRVFEVSMTDAIPWRVTGAYMEVVQAGG